MTTKRHGKALAEGGKANAAKLEPSAIQLLSTEYTQSVSLGFDAGSKTIGISATAEKEELHAAFIGAMLAS
ncbi:MAG: RRXRR domain-containing protein [Clostridiales bacterium]|jgi:hypothetical protein|nr:RRXRR domain-containing protein [Clostridiales bacterium]